MRTLSEIADLLADREGDPARIAVVKAASDHVLDAIIPAVEKNWVFPILIDDATKLQDLIGDRLSADQYQVIDCADEIAAAQKGVDLAREGAADILMKGTLPTGKFLKPVVNSDTGIRQSSLLSHVAVVENPAIGRLIGLTDGGMVTQPTKEDLPHIIAHGRQVMAKLGVTEAKVSLLSAAENVIRTLPSSVMQHEYVNEADDPLLDGPLSLDISLVPEIAAEKGYQGVVQGDASILVTPDIVSGNTLAKSLILFGNGGMAGVICGAKVPIVLTSRSASDSEKYYSIALASLMGGE